MSERQWTVVHGLLGTEHQVEGELQRETVAKDTKIAVDQLVLLGQDGSENIAGVGTQTLLYAYDSQWWSSNTENSLVTSPCPVTQPPPLSLTLPDDSRTSIDLSLFAASLSLAHAVNDCCLIYADTMRSLAKEQFAQKDALKVAVLNLLMHSTPVCAAFDNFSVLARKEVSRNASLIQTFPSDLQALHRIPIHPLITMKQNRNKSINYNIHDKDDPSRPQTFLSDYVPEDRLLLWAEKCKAAHDEYVRQFQVLSDAVKSLKVGCDSESGRDLDVDTDYLNLQLATIEPTLGTVHQTLKLLNRDYTRVQSILNDINPAYPTPSQKTTYAPNSSTHQQTLIALHHLHEIHISEYLPRIHTAATTLYTAAATFHEHKSHTTSMLMSRLTAISHLQTIISRDIRPLLSKLASSPTVPTGTSTSSQPSLLTRLAQAFQQLVHVHRMPTAWGALLIEIARRRTHAEILTTRAESFAKQMSAICTTEQKRRQGFDAEIGRYLPRNEDRVIVDGLSVDVCKIQVRVIKSGLEDMLPRIGKREVLEFVDFVSRIREAMVDVDLGTVGGGDAGKHQQQGLTTSRTSSRGTLPSSLGNRMDSISKLEATLERMVPQLDTIGTEIDRVLGRSGSVGLGGSNVAQLETENARLREELAAVKNSGKIGVLERASGKGKAVSVSNLEAADGGRSADTIKAYENRIRTLEDLLQKSYHMSTSRIDGSVTSNTPNISNQSAPETATLISQIADLESKLTTTTQSLQNYKSDLESAHSDNIALHQQITALQTQVQEKDREGRVVVGEVERCAGFVREVYGLLDECAGAFRVAARAGGGIENVRTVENAGGGSTSNGITYASPTSPSVGLIALVNAATSFGPANPTPPTVPAPQSTANPATLSSPQPRALSILSTLRTDEREIRRRLRELQDDIRCQTLELVGLQEDLAAGASGTSASGVENSGEVAVVTTALFQDDLKDSGEGVDKKIDVSIDKQSRNGHMSSLSSAIDELHTSKREIQRLNDVVEEFQKAFNVVKAEAVEASKKCNQVIDECKEKERDIEQLKLTLVKIKGERNELVESVEAGVTQIECLKYSLTSLQNEKGVVEKKLLEAVADYEALRLKNATMEIEWRAKHGKVATYSHDLESQIGYLKDRIKEIQQTCNEKIAQSETVRLETEADLKRALVQISDFESKLQVLESDALKFDSNLRLKDVEINRIEDLNEKLRVGIGREKGKIVKLREKIEDWCVICKMAMECLTVRFEALVSVGDSLAEMDLFVNRHVEQSMATESPGNNHPLRFKNDALDSFKLSLKMSTSLSNSAGDDSQYMVDAKTQTLELREMYLKMIGVVDSIDINAWADLIANACHGWKESLLTQNLRRALKAESKIAFTNFKIGDLALFLPTRNSKAWAAFHVNAPHYFLSINCGESLFSKQIKNRDWILGIITSLETRFAVKSEDLDENPFGLAAGTKFHLCDISAWKQIV